MKRNFYNPKTHVGIQPVRVLKWNVAASLENIYPGFSTEYQKILSAHGLKPVISYDYTKGPLCNVSYPPPNFLPVDKSLMPRVNAAKEIVIQEMFLSYLWILCYCHLVVFGEEFEKHYRNMVSPKKIKVDVRKLKAINRFYDYGVSLISKYKAWDKHRFPNPERYNDKNRYIEQTNNLFIYATDFVLLHELAHIKLGHLAPAKWYDPNDVRIKDEKNADRFATRAILKGALTPQDKLNRGIGVTIGLGALLLLKADPKNLQHPDSDDRLETLLRQLKLGADDKTWAIGWLTFRFWQKTYKQGITWPAKIGSMKQLFYDAYRQSNIIKTSPPKAGP
jgi:hypothetical protein